MVLKNSVSIKISLYFHWDLYSIVESSVRWCLIQTGSACPSLANQRERHQLHCGAHAPSLGGGAILLPSAAVAVHDEGGDHTGGVQERIRPQPGDGAQDAACD